MTTWNVLTITNTANESVHEGMMRMALAEHGLDHVRDDFGADPFEVTGNVFAGSWHSKYMLDEFDQKKLSKFLGPNFTVSHVEEWDDDEPGRTDTVFVDGEPDKRASSSLVDVSDLLSGERETLRNPTILTLAEFYTKGDNAFPEGTRVLVLPATPQARAEAALDATVAAIATREPSPLDGRPAPDFAPGS